MIRQRLVLSTLAAALVLAPLSAGAQIFGPSDEEKAHEAGQDSAIHDLQTQAQTQLPQQDARIRALEDKVRGLTDSLASATGANEELAHQVQTQNDKLDRMQKDFAYRLCTLSAQQLGAGDQMNCAAAGTPSAAMPPAAMGGGLRAGDALPPVSGTIDATGGGGFNPAPQRGRGAGTLGTLPSGPAPLSGSLAGNANQYQAAMALLKNAQYAEASAQFRGFADANPQDTDLAPQAIFWVANIAFIQQDYATAARNFAEVIKKYPKSTRAPDAMLKLAQSFISLGQKSDGCTTLGLIKTRYPDAASQTLGQAASLRKTACAKER